MEFAPAHRPPPTTIVLPDQHSGPNGRDTTLPNGWKLSPAGTPIPLPGDMPMQIIVTDNGKRLIVNTAGYHDHSVNIIDLQSCKVAQSVDVGKDWYGMCTDSDQDDIYVSGGGSPSSDFLTAAAKLGAPADLLASLSVPIIHLTYRNGILALGKGISIPGLSGDDRWISGLTSDSDENLYVLNINTDTIYKLGGHPKAVLDEHKVGYRPLDVALSPDGNTVAISNWGESTVSLLNPGDTRGKGADTCRKPSELPCVQ